MTPASPQTSDIARFIAQIGFQARAVLESGSTTSAPAPRFSRPFVGAFLAALVLCPLAGWNAWPFSDWELFSRLRSDRQTGWEAVAVDRSGRERPYALATPARDPGGFGATAARFPRRSVSARDATCATWLRGATARFGPGTRSVRIYRLDWLLSDRRGERAAPPQRTLTWTCDAKGARAEG